MSHEFILTSSDYENKTIQIKQVLNVFSVMFFRDIGVMVKLYPNMSAVLLHNSQLDHKRVSKQSEEKAKCLKCF